MFGFPLAGANKESPTALEPSGTKAPFEALMELPHPGVDLGRDPKAANLKLGASSRPRACLAFFTQFRVPCLTHEKSAQETRFDLYSFHVLCHYFQRP